MFDYKPKGATTWDKSMNDDLGWLPVEFEPFKPNSKYTWKRPDRLPVGKEKWPIVVPKNAPPIGDLPTLIKNLIKATWKFAEPSKGATRGNISIGLRGAQTRPTDIYHPQVRPTKSNIPTTFLNDNAIASDWKVFEQIKRTNAVTFRGDTRPPQEVIVNQGGFHPPNSRTDQYYIENNLYEAFRDYLERRYQRTLTKQEYLQAVTNTAPTGDSKKLLVDYMMWRKICEREAVHLGRMVENECEKGYISTARSIDTAITFGTGYNKKPGWLYVTMVHAGFIVPWDRKNLWGSEEAEIAQWGPIPAERIVGFLRLDQYEPKPGSPIFIRRSFRKSEPKAFEFIFNAMSGMNPS